MANGVNKAIIIGTVGQEPEIKSTNSGSTVANLSIATNESWKDKSTGQKVEKTEWHRCTAFGKLADIIAQYIHKGSLIYIEGKIQTDKYQKNGIDTWSTKIIINNMQMLGKKDESNRQPQQQQQNQGVVEETFDDDIPF